MPLPGFNVNLLVDPSVGNASEPTIKGINEKGRTSMKPIVVGIAGGSGSGKSTFSHLLVKELQGFQVHVINTDQHFKKVLPKMKSPLSNLEYDDFNHPNSLDYDQLMGELDKLLNAKIKADIIIMEGIFALYFEEIRKLLDLKLFIDLDADERMYRRIKRNMKNWGVSMEEVATYYVEAAKHREMEFILPTKKFAEIIVNGNKLEGKALDVISGWIKNNLPPISE